MPQVVGWVDGIVGGRVRGWVLDLAAPYRRLQVELVSRAGRRIALDCADHYRADVCKVGYGDGYCGFSLHATESVGPGEYEVATLHPRAKVPAMPLQRSATGLQMQQGDISIHLDRPIAGGCVSGWTMSRRSPDLRPVLSLRVDGRPTFRQRACLYRPDAAGDGYDAFRGFALPTPASFASLAVEELDSGLRFELTNGSAWPLRGPWRRVWRSWLAR